MSFQPLSPNDRGESPHKPAHSSNYNSMLNIGENENENETDYGKGNDDSASASASASDSDSSSESESDSDKDRSNGQDNSYDDSLNSDGESSTVSNSGAAIMSNFGKGNIGIEEGVAFSAASSLFFSNIAKGSDNDNANDNANRYEPGNKLDPNHLFRSSNNKHANANANTRKHASNDGKQVQGSRLQPVVNPYKRTAAVNPFAAVNPYKTKVNPALSSPTVNPYRKSSSASYAMRSPIPSTAENSNSRGPVPMSMNLASASMGGADIDFGKGPEQKSTAERPGSAFTVSDNIRASTSAPLGLPEKKPEQQIPLIDPSLYKPPPFQPKSDPIVHNLTTLTRPKASRRMIPVNQVFSDRMSKFWTSKFHSFNHMQSELSNKVAHSTDNIVVSAPTGAGKTALFEMAMGRLFDGYSVDHSSEIPKSQKIVYISPSKALCDERYNDWKTRLAQIDPRIACAVVTGDTIGYASFREVDDAHIILTTPEKWDAMTRKWTDHLFLIGSVKLLLIDEIHLIGDDSRGGCLEAVISRMKTVQRAAKAKHTLVARNASNDKHTYQDTLGVDMRIVCVSATLPNIVDIASFIDANEAHSFDSSYRPVPLTTHVVGLGYMGKNAFMFDKNLGKEVPGLLHRFGLSKPSIVFCHTKKQTEALALELVSTFGCQNGETVKIAKQTNLSSLKKCLERGIAFHHAGMETDNRHLVERAFSRGLIKCLCATSTLAMGVNLPAHLVIIKGTKVWRGPGQGYTDIDKGTLLQMMGRAGRPGFDTSGTAVIMTDKKSKPSYESMSTGLEVVESKLLKNLLEILNIEVSQNVIGTLDEAINWMKGTFFYTRVKKNSSHYGLLGKSEQEREGYLMDKCLESLKNLHNSNIITVANDGRHIAPKKASHVMSRHLVPFHTMQLIMGIPHDPGPLHILQMLSEMEGLHFPVRKAEKSKLNGAYKIIRYKLEGTPSKIRIQTPPQKAFVLIQSAIGQHFLDDYTLRQEMSLAVEYASRMLSAAEDFSKEESDHGQVALECMLMRRRLATSLWSSNDGVLNQVGGVGQKTAARLSMNGIKNFDDLLSKSSNEVEQACGRTSPFGQQLRLAASKIVSGRLSVSGHLEGMNITNQNPVLVCEISGETTTSASDVQDSVLKYTLVIHTDRAGGTLLFLSDLTGPSSHRVNCPSTFGRVYIRLVSNVVGLDSSLALDGNGTVEKSQFSLTPCGKNKVPKRAEVSAKKSSPNIMRHMVTGVDDLRVQKRKSMDVKARTPSLTKASSSAVKQSNSDRSIVTPSPSSNEGAVSTRERNALSKDHSAPSKKRTGHSLIEASRYGTNPVLSREPTRIRTQSGTSWKRQKKEQKILQQRAFGSPKENPFSSFKFDPNECEKELEKSCETIIPPTSHTPTTKTPVMSRSIIPKSTPTPTHFNKSPVMAHLQRRSRFSSLARSRNDVTSITSRLNIPRQEILRQKAQEQEALRSNEFVQSGAAPGYHTMTQHKEPFKSHYNELGQYEQGMYFEEEQWDKGNACNFIQNQNPWVEFSQSQNVYNNHLVGDRYEDVPSYQNGEQYQDVLPDSFADNFHTDYHLENGYQPFGQPLEDSFQPITQVHETYEERQTIPEGMIITVEGEANEEKLKADFESAFFG